jgi:hypothetical protein
MSVGRTGPSTRRRCTVGPAECCIRRAPAARRGVLSTDRGRVRLRPAPSRRPPRPLRGSACVQQRVGWTKVKFVCEQGAAVHIRCFLLSGSRCERQFPALGVPGKCAAYLWGTWRARDTRFSLYSRCRAAALSV